MNNKLKEKFSEIQRMKNTNMLDSKKNLKIEIVCGAALAIILGAVYYFYRSWEILVCLILVPPAMISFCIYAYFKEKRHDKSSGKDMQAFLSGEIKHHIAIEMSNAGVPAFECGHYATELPGIFALADALQNYLNQIKYRMDIFKSVVNVYSSHMP